MEKKYKVKIGWFTHKLSIEKIEKVYDQTAQIIYDQYHGRIKESKRWHPPDMKLAEIYEFRCSNGGDVTLYDNKGILEIDAAPTCYINENGTVIWAARYALSRKWIKKLIAVLSKYLTLYPDEE